MNDELVVYVNSNKSIYNLDKELEDNCDLIPFTAERNHGGEKEICKNLYVSKSNKSLIGIMLDIENLSKNELFKSSLTVLVFKKKYIENVTPVLFIKDNNNFKNLREEIFAN